MHYYIMEEQKGNGLFAKGFKGWWWAPVARSGSGPGRCFPVFPKVDAASPRGLMAPPGLRPWAPRVLSGIGSAFRTGSPGSALGSYVVSLCAYPAWDTQVSRSWPLACPIRGLPFSRLTDWGGTAPCGANINAALRRRPPLVAGATTFPPQAGAQQPVLYLVAVKKPPFAKIT